MFTSSPVNKSTSRLPQKAHINSVLSVVHVLPQELHLNVTGIYITENSAPSAGVPFDKDAKMNVINSGLIFLIAPALSKTRLTFLKLNLQHISCIALLILLAS